MRIPIINKLTRQSQAIFVVMSAPLATLMLIAFFEPRPIQLLWQPVAGLLAGLVFICWATSTGARTSTPSEVARAVAPTVNMPDREPTITINGSALTTAQAMTLRVAIGHFASCIPEHGLGNDSHGKTLATNYVERAQEIEALMLSHTAA